MKIEISDNFFKKYIAIALAIIIFQTVAITVMLSIPNDSDKFTVSMTEIIPESCIEDDSEIIEVKAMMLKKSDEMLKDGYVYVKMNEEYINDGNQYIVWVRGNNERTPYTMFTLSKYTEWTMMPLIYEDQHIVILSMTDEDYEGSFTDKNFIYQNTGFKDINGAFNRDVDVVCSYRISGVGNYYESDACFTNKTVYVYWEDDCDLVKFGNELIAEIREQFTECDEEDIKYKYACEILKAFSPKYSCNEYEYNHEVVDNGTDYGKPYSQIIGEDTFESKVGLCRDFSNIFCVLMRSQGYRAEYISGDKIGESVAHAWNGYSYAGDEMVIDITNKLHNYSDNDKVSEFMSLFEIRTIY